MIDEQGAGKLGGGSASAGSRRGWGNKLSCTACSYYELMERVQSQKVGAMAGSLPPATSGRIFISYRREETAYPAGWLYDRLVGHFGGQVFKDVDSIQLGDDFVEVITRAVGSCDVLLALIGAEWLTITDEHERPRLDNPDDFVRLEIEAALSRRVRVIPVLVGGARMPRAEDLPDSMAALVRRQALELSPTRFDFDTSRLLKVLDRTLAETRATQQDSPNPAPMGTVPDLSPTVPPEQPEQRKEASLGPAPGVQPAGPATPARRSLSEAGTSEHKRPRRLSARTRVLAGAGVGLVLILVIVAVVANSGATPSTSGTSTTTPPSANGVLFQDDFSSRASEWGSFEPGAGRYTNGAYRISSPAGAGEGAIPGKASGVDSSAPSNILIEVQGRRLPASDQNMQYGIGCRVDGDNAYVFTISDDYASIEKYGRYKILQENAKLQVNAHSINRLQAICASVEGKHAVHLELWVNGQKAVETTDMDTPLPTGTIGLFVGNDPARRVSVAEFDNFAVSRL
jgi:hypothetical protein